MDKKEAEDKEKKSKETPSETDKSKNQNKSQNAPTPQEAPAQGQQGAPQPQQYQTPAQGYQGSNSPPPGYYGQPVPYNYPPSVPYGQGRPYPQKKTDNRREQKEESEQQTYEQNSRNKQNLPYSPFPPPYLQYQVPPFGYPGTSQMPPPQYQSSPNTPGYPPQPPYQYAVQVRPQNSSPYQSKAERQEPVEPTRGYTGFSDKEVRRIFVRKVYLILLAQLIFTLGMISLFVFEPHVKLFVREYYYIQYIALAVFIAVYIGLSCCGNLRRKYPTNIILLTVFTIAAAIMMGSMSSYHSTNAVLIAVGICATVCFAVTLFSFHTKFDFTTCGGVLCILLLVLVLFGIIAIFVHEKVMTMIYAGLGAVVFMLYLAYDTQMLMGGKNVEISPEEYILAAIQLYIDVIYIFMFLLMLVGGYQD